MNLIFHEFGHYLDNNSNYLMWLVDKFEKHRAEQVAECAELHFGLEIAKRWDELEGTWIARQTYRYAKKGLKKDIKSHPTIEGLVEHCELASNANMFNMALLHHFNYDTKKLWNFLSNSSRKRVFDELQKVVKRHGSLKSAVVTGINGAENKFFSSD